MKKLSLEALQNKAELVVSKELLNSISGGMMHDCHDDYEPKTKRPEMITQG